MTGGSSPCSALLDVALISRDELMDPAARVTHDYFDHYGPAGARGSHSPWTPACPRPAPAPCSSGSSGTAPSWGGAEHGGTAGSCQKWLNPCSTPSLCSAPPVPVVLGSWLSSPGAAGSMGPWAQPCPTQAPPLSTIYSLAPAMQTLHQVRLLQQAAWTGPGRGTKWGGKTKPAKHCTLQPLTSPEPARVS